MGTHSPTMVLKTWLGGETASDGDLTQEAIDKFDERVVKCMETVPEGADRPRLGTLATKYMANREHALASDQALRSVTPISGVAHFRADRLAGRLVPSEERCDIPYEELPADVQAVSKDCFKRSCFHVIVTCETFLEVAWGLRSPAFGGVRIWKAIHGNITSSITISIS